MPASSRMRAVLAPALVLLIFATSGISLGDSANFSGLQGADLKLSVTFADLARELLSGKKGKIERVHVVEDRAESLTLQITYSGLESSGLVLSAFAEDSKHRRIGAVSEAKTTLSSTEGEATVKLELASGIAEGAKLDQSFLVVQVGKESTAKKDAIKVFQCTKKWEKGIAPENLQINVVAEPIGRSKTLPGSRTVTIRAGAVAVFKPVGGLILSPAAKSPSSAVVMRRAGTGTSAVASSISGTVTGGAGTTGGQITTITMCRGLATLQRPNLALGLPADVKGNKGQGPSANAVRLFDMLKSDVGLSAEDVMDLHPNIYEDGNPDSGYFYYLPRSYYLYWDDDTGYALRILYGASRGESSVNTVSVAARLTSGIDPGDISLARSLLQKYCTSTGRKFRELKPFAFSNMAVSLKGDLGQYSIPAENISVTGISDIAGMIDISLTTDPVTKENLQMVLTQGLGINGVVTYQSASASGEGGLEVSIPVSIKFADKHSFGTRTFARGSKFKNASLYPIKLKHVNVLMSEAEPIVYSYDLSDTSVPASASAVVDGTKIPTWLDTSALKLWVDYSVVGSDEDGNKQAIEAVTGGVTSVAQSEIAFRTLSPLADTGVAVVLVTVSSKYFDPNSSGETVKTVELTQDGATFSVGPVYLVDRQPGQEKPGDPLFKFKLTVVNPDGTTKEGTQWTESNNLTIYVGAAQLRPIIGEPAAGEG